MENEFLKLVSPEKIEQYQVIRQKFLNGDFDFFYSFLSHCHNSSFKEWLLTALSTEIQTAVRSMSLMDFYAVNDLCLENSRLSKIMNEGLRTLFSQLTVTELIQEMHKALLSGVYQWIINCAFEEIERRVNAVTTENIPPWFAELAEKLLAVGNCHPAPQVFPLVEGKCIALANAVNEKKT